MNIPLLICLVLSILALVASAAVFFVLWGRLIADEARINAALGSKDDIARLDKEIKEAIDRVAHTVVDITSLQESLQSINSKWANRIRSDEARERREREREEKNGAENNRIDVEQQDLIDQINAPPALSIADQRRYLKPKKLMYIKKQGG